MDAKTYDVSVQILFALIMTMSTTTTDNKDKPLLVSAPPPWHSVALVVTNLIVFGWLLPSLESVDQVATLDTFAHRVFPKLLSVQQLALVRGLIAVIIWSVTIHMSCLSQGWQQETTYLPGSKLKRIPNTIGGWKTLCPFTSWCWNLLGLYFTLSSYLAYASSQEQAVSPWILRLALAVWHISAPFTLLVAAVIRYAIWPAVLKAPNGNTANLKSLRNIFMHSLNVSMALVETAFLGGLPMLGNLLSFATLFGWAYVVFSWYMSTKWNDVTVAGPQFIYFFFDTTLPGWTPSIVLLALLAVFMLFFGIFVAANSLLNTIEGQLSSDGAPSVIVRILFVVIISSGFMRFRD